MTQAQTQLTFEEYLNLTAEDWLHYDLPEGPCEYVDGGVIELPPESGLNDGIANYLFFVLVNAGIPIALVRPGKCEIVVPVLRPKTPRTRYPDLVVLRPEHEAMVQHRLTIQAEMPAPRLVAEVVSPNHRNRDRDYDDKRQQYEARGIPEYWLIDPDQQTVLILELKDEQYVEVGTFRGNDRLQSPTFQELSLTVTQILSCGAEG